MTFIDKECSHTLQCSRALEATLQQGTIVPVPTNFPLWPCLHPTASCCWQPCPPAAARAAYVLWCVGLGSAPRFTHDCACVHSSVILWHSLFRCLGRAVILGHCLLSPLPLQVPWSRQCWLSHLQCQQTWEKLPRLPAPGLAAAVVLAGTSRRSLAVALSPWSMRATRDPRASLHHSPDQCLAPQAR